MLVLPLYDDNPRTNVPLVTYGLIAACCVVFLWQQSLPPRAGEEVAFAYGSVPSVLFGTGTLPPQLRLVPPWVTLFTSMFLHGGWLHLLGNMLYLWLFGRGVESAMGSARYFVFYLLCGVAAALTQALADPAAEIPMIGASGAIAGTLGAYLILHPRANVMVFVWIFVFVRLIAVPAVLVLGLWFLMQLLSALSESGGGPGVAFWAHVGGFVLGMALVPLFRRREVTMLQPRRSAPFSTRRPQRGPWG
jgi:membrane associated rhomboid family serine protease